MDDEVTRERNENKLIKIKYEDREKKKRRDENEKVLKKRGRYSHIACCGTALKEKKKK